MSMKERMWKTIEELSKLFWDVYYKESGVDEWVWRRILEETRFDWLEQEIDDGYYEIIEIGTMISEKKALIITREGYVVIIVKDPYESIFTGWANREPLTEEETATALSQMTRLIDKMLKYVYGV